MRGPLAAAVLWARTDIRRRWPSLLVLGLIAGITGGLALGCLGGAIRTGTALDRLRERTDASDAIVFPSQVEEIHPSWDGLANAPEVEEVGVWSLVFGQQVDDPEGLVFMPVGDRWLRTIDRPMVVDGRMFDPTTDDEVVVSADDARAEGISVGDTLPFTPYTEAELGQEGPASGPRLTLRVVGLVRSSLDHLFTGMVIVSPGLVAHHPEVAFLENAVVRLRPGEGSIGALQRTVNEDVAEAAPVLDLGAVARRVETTTDVERSALLGVAAAIALAGVVLAGQAVSRSAASIGADAPVLGACGLPRRAMAAAAVASHLPAAAVAGATCLVGGVLMSRVLPFGLAGRLDPDRGVRLDPWIVVPGTIGVAVGLLGAAAVAAWRATAPRAAPAARESLGIGEWVRRHTPPAVGIGSGLAFSRTRDRLGAAARPALLGAVVGVVGIVAAATVDAGLHDALSHPERAGVVWDAQLPGTEDSAPVDLDASLFAAVRRVDGVEDVAQVDRALVSVDDVGVPAYSVRPAGGPAAISLTVLDGRGPLAPGEVALGPATARALDVTVGDEVAIGPEATPVIVVGTTLFPTDVHAGFDEGVWLVPTELDAATGPGERQSFLAVRFTPGVDPAGPTAWLQRVAAEAGTSTTSPAVPPELSNLRDVVPLPRWLAAFLAMLAVAAVLHVLATTARLRAHDFAVLRAVGMTRRGTRLVLHVQSGTTLIVGLALGIPLGVVVGRSGWRLIASSVPLGLVMPVAVIAIVLLVPGVLLVSQVIAVGPSRRVHHQRPAAVLRTE